MMVAETGDRKAVMRSAPLSQELEEQQINSIKIFSGSVTATGSNSVYYLLHFWRGWLMPFK
jgi:hypothetical protein